MDLTESAADRAFREEVRTWLAEHLVGEWAALRGRGGAGREHEGFAERRAWNRLLAEHGWTCPGWPVEHGGRGLSLWQQVIFHEEYARADAPATVNHLGETLLGPTLLAFGTAAQQERFLPPIRAVDELWAQGYSEPEAGSDLANVRTRARLVSTGSTTNASGSTTEVSGSTTEVSGSTTEVSGSTTEVSGSTTEEWVLDGQKVWTSNAHLSDWIFVLARTEAGSRRHHGLSFLLVPLDQDGVEIRPIEQLTGGSEFNEVFFDGARTAADLVVGEPGGGWPVAMGLLGFERGVSTLGQTVGFARELAGVVARAEANGRIDDPVVRDRLAGLQVELSAIRSFALRALARVEDGQDSAAGGGAGSIFKLAWAGWHRRLGEVAMDVAGTDGLLTRGDPASYDLDRWQRLFLFSRADTLYGGSDEIQRTILAERVLGLPAEPKGDR